MASFGEHLGQERLSGKALEILKEFEDWFANIKLEDMDKMKDSRLYCCKNDPALLDLVKRLIDELPFITIKVFSNQRLHLVTNTHRILFPDITPSENLMTNLKPEGFRPFTRHRQRTFSEGAS